MGGASAFELARIEALFGERERRFSRFDPSSELSVVNRSRAAAHPVSGDFARMLGLALAAAADTEGAVVPTLGRAMARAGYDRDFAALVDAPSASADPCHDLVSDGRGWRDVRIEGRVVHRPPGLVLDLNGVTKGTTVDDALDLLSRDGVVSAGGDLAVSGAIDVGLPGGDAVRVVSGGLATSSTGRRRWRRGGVWQHHLIDPASGRPARTPWSDVTVSASSCLGADVAAKAALLRGDDGPTWLAAHGLAGRFRRPSGELVLSEGWPADVDAVRGPECT